MSANDEIVLKANYSEWKVRAVDLKGIQPWLYYCVEQFMKPFSLDDDEIQYGITDGGNDGGADAIFFLVNQGQAVAEDTALDRKNVTKIQLIIMQAKESGGFKPTEIEKWIELSDDFLDLSKAANSFGMRYNNKVVQMMRIWKDNYLKLSSGFPELSIDYYYITGDDVVPDAYARDSGNRVRTKALKHVKGACEVHFIGAQQLWEQVQRRAPKSKLLNWAEQPMSTEGGVRWSRKTEGVLRFYSR
jgi:hypothetical protein